MRSLGKAAMVTAAIPAFFVTDLYSRSVFQEMFFKTYKGESEDRLRFLSEELFDEVLKPSIFERSLRVDERSKSLDCARYWSRARWILRLDRLPGI